MLCPGNKFFHYLVSALEVAQHLLKVLTGHALVTSNKISKRKRREGVFDSEIFASLCQSIHNGKCHPILFYHLKKLLYQLYHIILQYTQHPIFYFPIQHIKIIYLHNKIFFSLNLIFLFLSLLTTNHHLKPRPKIPNTKTHPKPQTNPKHKIST